MFQLTGKEKITVIGSGVSGFSAALCASKRFPSVFLSDQGVVDDRVKERAREAGIAWEEEGHSERAWQSDLVVVSSGIPPTACPVLEARKRGLPLISEADFVFPWLHAKLIGVSGSNGKTTTTALLAHLLREGGYEAEAAGNIGAPLADFVGRELDFLVVELSSFQLHWSQGLRLAGALLTNLAPDHIDWHGSFEAYVAAKMKLFSFLPRQGWGILQYGDAESLAKLEVAATLHRLTWEEKSAGPGDILLTSTDAWQVEEEGFRKLFQREALSLPGKHNFENAAMASAAASLIGLDTLDITRGLLSFHSLPHRCEVVGDMDGLRFVDDSKGTNVAATVTALSSLEGPKVILLGGKGKGEDYTPLALAVQKEARYAVLYGVEAPAIAKALKEAGYARFEITEDLSGAFSKALEQARPGDTILLSPACTSWDQYPNYKERGRHFCRLVEAISHGKGDE